MALERFIRFLNRSPTVYHASREISNTLAESDFTPIYEGEKWDLKPGERYFVMREDTLIAAFTLPKKKPKSATILATHIDSPALKIKPQVHHEPGLLNTESYGGPLLHTWFDRDLAIAGRIVTMQKNGECESQVVFLDDYPVIIPALAIHLDRGVNEKGLNINKQDHLRAIYTLGGKEKPLTEWLHKHHSFKKLLSFDLYLVPLEKASFLGFDSEFIASYRIDNLSSAYAALYALQNAKANPGVIQMALFWDHEEIGSTTYTGADSTFVNEVLERICLKYKMDKEDLFRLKSQSYCLSCDAAHAHHPNFPDKFDPENAPHMGKGPAIKYSPKYATTGATAATLVNLAEKHKIPLQSYASRSDIPTGSTVGAMMAANLGIPTVDLGLACWAMHSIRETIAVQDEIWLGKLLKAALEETLVHPEES